MRSGFQDVTSPDTFGTRAFFITTSTFTWEAREFGRQIAESVVLIDGARLAGLMIEHGVGVTHYRVCAFRE